MEPCSQHLELRERVAFTGGACGLFLAALARVVPGTPCILRSDDPRLLARREWPIDETLELHAFLRLSDGSVVDAEGCRPLLDLPRAWGVRRGERFEVVEDPRFTLCRKAMGCGDEAVVTHLANRLRRLGWDRAPPAYADARPRLTNAALRRINAGDRSWWDAWLAEAHAAFRATSSSDTDHPPHPSTLCTDASAPAAPPATASAPNRRRATRHG